MSSPATAPANGAGNPSRDEAVPVPRAVWWIVLSGFVLRVAVMLWTKAYLFSPATPITDPSRQGWYFGYEIGRVARSIAEGRGFASPFHGNTGLTAWLAPIYPYILAGVFRVFGVYSHASGVAILLFNNLCAALTSVPMYLIAERTLGRRVAMWAVAFWAVMPIFIDVSVKWAWESSLSTLMLMFALWLALRVEASGWRGWFACGLLWGMIALTNPSLLSLAPFALAWAWWRAATPAAGSQSQRSHAAVFVALAIAVAGVTITPWLVRNRQTFGQWLFVRDNLGAELRYGNAEQARGMWLGWMNPSNSNTELERYRALGEVRYIAEKKREALAFIRNRPAMFLNLCLRRAVLFWVGIPQVWSDEMTARDILPQWPQVSLAVLAFAGLWHAARRKLACAWFYAPALFVYPLLYYVTFPDAHYRYPIEPVMMILAAYVVTESIHRSSVAAQPQ